MAQDGARVWEALRGAWGEALPGLPFTPDASWRETGLDSLKALGLALRLELALGRRIPYEGLGADATPADLVRAILGEAPAADPDLPRVFLVPGLFGDEPRLADLRRALAHAARFTLVELPEVDAPSRVLASIPRTAALCADAVAAAQPQGELLLIGYSFGALVAQEATRQLEARGRTVRRLVALDGLLRLRPGDGEAIGLARPARRISASPQSGPARAQQVLFSVLFNLHLTEAARRFLLALAPRRDPLWVLERARWIVSRLRGMAVLRWRPRPCAAPALLVESRDFDRFSSEPRWRGACPSLQVLKVDAPHLDLFEPEALAVLAPALAAAVAAGA